MVHRVPLSVGNRIQGTVNVDGAARTAEGYGADIVVASPSYFETMGIRVVAGRDFTARDNAIAAPVTIVSRSVARHFWPPEGLGAIGGRITDQGENPKPEDWRTIVGVVDDIAQGSVTQGRDGALYFPTAQTDNPGFVRAVTFAVRTARGASDLAPSLRAVVREVDPSLAIQRIRSMSDIVSASVGDLRLEMRLLTIFAALALLLAAVGTYGVLAYDVAARTHEIGLRVALGAVPSDIVAVVLRRTVSLVAPGLVLGLACAALTTRVLQKSLFQVTPTDPATLAGVVGTLVAVAVIAGLAPMRRAMRVDPMTALKSD
jgi:predicted permease